MAMQVVARWWSGETGLLVGMRFLNGRGSNDASPTSALALG